MTRPTVRMLALAVLLGTVYYWCLVRVIGVSAALVLPSFLPRTTVGVVPWQEITHLIAVAISAVPVAAALFYLAKDLAIRWALIVGVGVALFAFLPTVLDSRLTIFTPFWWGALFVFAHIKIAVVPALFVCLFQRLMPSNQPLHPTPSALSRLGAG